MIEPIRKHILLAVLIALLTGCNARDFQPDWWLATRYRADITGNAVIEPAPVYISYLPNPQQNNTTLIELQRNILKTYFSQHRYSSSEQEAEASYLARVSIKNAGLTRITETISIPAYNHCETPNQNCDYYNKTSYQDYLVCTYTLDVTMINRLATDQRWSYQSSWSTKEKVDQPYEHLWRDYVRRELLGPGEIIRQCNDEHELLLVHLKVFGAALSNPNQHKGTVNIYIRGDKSVIDPVKL